MLTFGSATSDQTERAMAGQLLFGFLCLVLLVLFAAGAATWGHFIGWVVMTVCCSALVGALLGLLFGLPIHRVDVTNAISRVKVISDTAAAPASSVGETTGDESTAKGETTAPSEPVVIPYAESSSLEQVADWLTKIIIGVTLTQYASWEQRFFELAVDVTANLNGSQAQLGECLTNRYRSGLTAEQAEALLPVCARTSGGAIPGGLLMVTFATLGFLIAYLWMRRYFIIEMVVARNGAIETMRRAQRAKEQLEMTRVISAVEQVRAEAAAAKLKSDAELERALQAIKAEFERERASLRDDDKRERAKSLGTLQIGESEHPADDVLAYAKGVLTRAQQLLPNSERAQGDIGAMLTQLPTLIRYPDDPWRGLFGGSMESLADSVMLRASVKPLALNPNEFEVTLTVEPLDPDRVTLSGQKALFFLHPTFGRDPRAVSFGPDGRAVLPLIAYGAFTVGVLLESGEKLELNLAEVADAPAMFRVT
ncbi:pYEATS domain-containing protein [uncultured Sphingomonas sp.]|uniref:pYEATS domain-containing protein n=1 Tax=uncultured Sphingomonas sp. TaxID=158754 RepID=UPI0030F4FD46